MNIIEAMRVWRYDLPYGTGGQPEYIDAANRIETISAQYDALAPAPEMWAQAPDWARWYTVDRESCSWWENEPSPGDGARWTVLSTPHGRWDCDWSRRPVITPGIDWRLCKWQRPGVTG